MCIANNMLHHYLSRSNFPRVREVRMKQVPRSGQEVAVPGLGPELVRVQGPNPRPGTARRCLASSGDSPEEPSTAGPLGCPSGLGNGSW